MNATLDRLATCQMLLRPRRPQTLSGRLLVVAVSIVVAAAADAVTGGQWRWILAGGAALTSLLALVPGLAALVKPIAAYLAVWLVFNLLRARADDTEWADQVLGLVPRLEAALFAGRLPSAVLQERFYESSVLAWYDCLWTAIYLSFFVVPHLVATLLLWRNQRLYWRFLLATGVLFALALAAFIAIPTSPPWLVGETNPDAGLADVQRVTKAVVDRLDSPVRVFNERDAGAARASEVRIEPNPIAAMPSIHFAATALLVFPARRAGRSLAAAAMLYAGLMAAALVYLGEHYVLDVAVGGAMAAVGWAVTGACFGEDGEAADSTARGQRQETHGRVRDSQPLDRGSDRGGGAVAPGSSGPPTESTTGKVSTVAVNRSGRGGGGDAC